MMHRYAAAGLKLTLALALGLAVGLTYQKWTAPADTVAAVDPATLHQTSALAPATLPASPITLPVAVRLDASVLTQGGVHDSANGRVGLVGAGRFKLKVSSNSDGALELHAINPDGSASPAPLWSAQVRAGRPVVTPVLRLEGLRGLETLRLVLRVNGQGIAAQREVQIWHR